MRVTVPEGHIAVIMSEQLAIETSTLLLNMRHKSRGHTADSCLDNVHGTFKFKGPEFSVAGDAVLAIASAIQVGAR